MRFIRPPFCERCGLPYPGDLTAPFECTNCREMELHFSSARSAVVARGIVREAIHRYKYQRALWFEPFLADLLIREAKPVLRGQSWDFIVPVPLHPVKHREREFNQAERLASHLSAATEIPLNKKLLRRVIPTATQTLLTREQRAKNMRGAFAVRRRRRPGRRANRPRGRRVHDRRDHQRVREGAEVRRRGRRLRLDSCARALNLISSRIHGYDFVHEEIAWQRDERAGADAAAG